jgi:hypothetical protein
MHQCWTTKEPEERIGKGLITLILQQGSRLKGREDETCFLLDQALAMYISNIKI